MYAIFIPVVPETFVRLLGSRVVRRVELGELLELLGEACKEDVTTTSTGHKLLPPCAPPLPPPLPPPLLGPYSFGEGPISS